MDSQVRAIGSRAYFACRVSRGASRPGARRKREAAVESCGFALARVRERDHLGDALEVYLAQIEPAIRASDNHTYAGAVEWLEKAQALYARLGQGHAFDELVLGLRERYRAKRNLIKRLDERSWPRPLSERAVHS